MKPLSSLCVTTLATTHATERANAEAALELAKVAAQRANRLAKMVLREAKARDFDEHRLDIVGDHLVEELRLLALPQKAERRETERSAAAERSAATYRTAVADCTTRRVWMKLAW